MVPSIFETTKKRVPEATESRHKCAAESRSVCRTTSIERPNSKFTREEVWRSDQLPRTPFIDPNPATSPRRWPTALWLCVAQLPNSPLSETNVGTR